MKKIKALTVAAIIMALGASTAKAQVEVSAGAGLVSSYIWRGLYCGPASFQPGIGLSAGDFTIGAWGSASLSDTHREFDLYAGYSIGNFGITVTDYFFPTTGLSDYFDYSGHVFEATLAYSFGESLPLSLAWNSNFAGDDDFSSYFEAGYSVSAGDVTVDFALGATPWAGAYSDGFALINASIKASKEIKITDSFSLPVFTQAVINPDAKDVFLAFGISF